jgi:polysaccharide deacetylase family protein (PEP-CTERM system associated)
VKHHFTVDVEEYFQVVALSPHIPRDAWSDIPSRLEPSIERLLRLLDEHDAGATFFTLGWIAERHPDLVRRIASAGHEIASHGHAHRRVTELSPARFRESVRRSKQTLEDVIGSRVAGYRAPSFSITRGTEWALEILAEEGYDYDSSLFPAWRRGYGYRGAHRHPHALEVGERRLLEFPPSTVRRLGTILPAAGGAYLRLLPLALVRSALRQAEREGHPGTLYIHPWELDPDQPRLGVPPATRLRHYGGLRRVEGRIQRLLKEFRFQSVAATIRAGHATEPRSNRYLVHRLAC